MLSPQEIDKIASLARLGLSEEEKSRFAKELSEVIDYFKKLQELDTSRVDLNLSETENTNRTRLDKSKDFSSQEKILANAPMREDTFIKVKSVL